MSEFYEGRDNRNEDISVVSYDISVIPNDFNVLTIYNLLEKGVISMPNFQRNYVWDRKRASRFIESLMLGLPVPQIFLYQVERNKYSVIDGQQRLMSIYFFIKQRFPRAGKRVYIRRLFDENGGIPDENLNDDTVFQDFSLQFLKMENGDPHPLDGKKYLTLDPEKKDTFELMPIRCMSIRQNKPDDDGSMYEIFNRLNTGGLNLSSQEIRGCLYDSSFYKAIYIMNHNEKWRKLLGKLEEDDKFRDVEIILRAFALLYKASQYKGSMIQFLNKFSKDAQAFQEDEISKCQELFNQFLAVIENVDRTNFLTKNGSFNVSLFDSVFVAICNKIKDGSIPKVTNRGFNELRNDPDFTEAITHSTSHVDSVKTRLKLAEQYLFEL